MAPRSVTAPTGPPSPPDLPPSRRAREWDLDTVRTALLVLGSVLLVLSAVGFAGYEWTRLDQVGKAVALVLLALGSCAAGLALRRRLPATAEALAAVGQLTVAVDWVVFRHAGLGRDLAFETWCAMGAVVVASIGLGLGARGLDAGRVIGAAAGILAIPLLVDIAVPLAPWSTRPGPTKVAVWAAMAALAVTAARMTRPAPSWRVATTVVAIGALALQVVASVLAIVLGVEVVRGHLFPSALSGLAICSVALGPFLARVLPESATDRESLDDAVRDGAVPVGTSFLLGGIFVGLSGFVSGDWLPTLLIAVAAGFVLVARVVPRAVAREITRTAAAAACVGAAFLIAPSLAAVLAPLGWFRHPWSGSLDLPARQYLSGPRGSNGLRPTPVTLVGVRSPEFLAGLIALAAGVLGATDGSSRRREFGNVADAPISRAGDRPIGRSTACGILAVLAVPILAMVPLALRFDILGVIAFLGVAFIGVVAAFAWWARRHVGWETRLLGLMGAIAVPLLGWSAATRTSTSIAIGLGVAASIVAALATRLRSTRQASLTIGSVLLVVWVPVIDAGTHGALVTNLTVTVVAAVVLVALQFLSDDGTSVFAEGVAIAGLVVPDLWLADHRSWFVLAWCLTVGVAAPGIAAVTAHLAGVRPPRSAYLLAPIAGVAPLTWAWLAADHVRLMEAYTWPTAAALTVITLTVVGFTEGTGRGRSSWFLYGPGLVLALAPSTFRAITECGSLRPLILAAVAVAIVIAGAHRRLAAPIVLGGATLVVLGIDAAIPLLRGGPRWPVLGVAGAILVWVGATLEQRKDEFQRLRSRYRQLG
jgi:hypothetical protein